MEYCWSAEPVANVESVGEDEDHIVTVWKLSGLECCIVILLSSTIDSVYRALSLVKVIPSPIIQFSLEVICPCGNISTSSVECTLLAEASMMLEHIKRISTIKTGVLTAPSAILFADSILLLNARVTSVKLSPYISHYL